MSSGLEDFSLFDLFRMEAEEQVRVLQEQLIELEKGSATAATLEALMRAAHSLKGAARIIGLDVIVHLTHAMEDRFVAAQAGSALTATEVDRMLRATDWLAQLQAVPEAETAAWLEENTPLIQAFTATFHETETETPAEASTPAAESDVASVPVPPPPSPTPPPAPQQPVAEENEDFFGSKNDAHAGGRERSLRIAATTFDRILSLTSHTLVASRQIVAGTEELERIRHALHRTQDMIVDAETVADRMLMRQEMERQIKSLEEAVTDLDVVARANERAVERLYRNVLAGRLRPFAEGISGVARLVRDTARSLNKSVQLEVLGENTRVDRDILERLEAPISHLISNAIDHGIETPDERVLAGKPAEAKLRLHARHENGRLVITVRDDGHGISREQVRQRIVKRNLVTAETAQGLADEELLEFLFLPGFSTRDAVSEISGRGVGLNVVQSMVQEAGGSVTVSSEEGIGTVFRLTLPVTRSVIRVIRLQVDGETYAVPLVRIDRVMHAKPARVQDGEKTVYTVESDGVTLPVVQLSHLLGFNTAPLPEHEVSLLVSGGIAFAVDRLVDETELPVRKLDSRLGKIPGVSAASLDEDGLPLLILDMEDLALTAQGRASQSAPEHISSDAPHILVVDDSHTVREMERRLLDRAGYLVTTAQNGQEAWNLLRLSNYDLLISDVDMPQMNGIELVTKVRENPRLGRMPVIILSYKDNEEDRRRGLDAGADFYLTKGDFKNNTFLQAVVDLIGTAEPISGEEIL